MAPAAPAPSPPEAAVVAAGLFKRFGAVVASDGVELVVPRGARFGLIGQNGAGKTTFIKMLLGICRPDAGVVTVLGGDPEDPAIRRRVGYLPEQLTIPPSYSALQFLDSVGRFKGLPSGRRADACRDVLARVGLAEDAWRRKTGGFSKGMRQRTGLAAALLGAPELLILDEPTDGIDPLGRKEIRDVILAAARDGATLFLNSHLLAETEKVCDHVAVLHKGRVVVSGALTVLQRKDAFRVRFTAGSVAPASLAEVAVRCGFMPVSADLPDAPVAPPPEAGQFSFSGSDPQALGAALQQALAAGLCVVELKPELVDLESVLARSTRAEQPARAEVA